MHSVLDQMSTLVMLYRDDPDVHASLPAVSPLGGGPLEPILFGLVDLGLELAKRPLPVAAVTASGVALTLHLAAIAAGRDGHWPTLTEVARLAGFQAQRLSLHRGPDTWRSQSPRHHLGCAFRQILRLAAHYGRLGPRVPHMSLLDTTADLANYVAFTLETAGVFATPERAESRGGARCGG